MAGHGLDVLHDEVRPAKDRRIDTLKDMPANAGPSPDHAKPRIVDQAGSEGLDRDRLSRNIEAGVHIGGYSRVIAHGTHYTQ
jgi:hypothetical protein